MRLFLFVSFFVWAYCCICYFFYKVINIPNLLSAVFAWLSAILIAVVVMAMWNRIAPNKNS